MASVHDSEPDTATATTTPSGATAWKSDVVNKLVETYQQKDPETLARVLWYLGDEEKSHVANVNANPDDPNIAIDDIPPGWKVLRSTLGSDDPNLDALFKQYADQLAEDTREPGRDTHFRRDMKLIHDRMKLEENQDELVSGSDSESDDHNNSEKFVMVRAKDYEEPKLPRFGPSNAVTNYLWGLIEHAAQNAILQALPPIIINRQFIFAIEEGVVRIEQAGANVIMAGLAAITLTFEATKNLYRWWGGQISGIRCAKNIVDASFTVGGGLLGGVGGAALGSCVGGPFGSVAGGLIGGIVSSSVFHALADRMTQSLFALPKDEALENALKFLGVGMKATNEEINAAYRKLCLKHHPDKGGVAEEFILLQVNMGVIKLSRGELL